MRGWEALLPVNPIDICPEYFPAFRSSGVGKWVPPLDIYEGDEGLIFKMDIPEIDVKDIDIQLGNGTLKISGERKREENSGDVSYHRSERFYGSFSRSFTLPNWADGAKIEATYEKGALKMRVPRLPESKPKSFNVKLK